MRGKGGSAGFAAQRYRPVSDFDNDTLAQKREYWRNKKREQRARLAERRRARPKPDGRGARQPASEVGASQASGCRAAGPPQAQRRPNPGNAVHVSLTSLREKRGVQGAGDASPSQKERWFQTMKLNQVLPQFAASGHVANITSAFDSDPVKCQSTGGTAGGYITSPRSRCSGGAALDVSAPSVPPTRVTLHQSGTAAACQLQSKMSTKGSSPKAAPHAGVHRQGVPSPKAQHKAQVVCAQPKTIHVDVTTGLKVASSTHLAPVKVERSAVANQAGLKKSALGTGRRPDKPRVSPASEEERAAKRREQWRIKKREQRAKLAARSPKGRERTPCGEAALQRTGVSSHHRGGGLKHLPSPSPARSPGHKQSVGSPKAPGDGPAGQLAKNARVTVDSSPVPRHACTAVKREEETSEQSGVAATLNTAEPAHNQSAAFVKVENPHVGKKTQSALAPNVAVEKRLEPSRKFSNYTYFSNVSRGIARCRTPRQRFVDTQKCFSSQRGIRVKFPTLATVYNSRNVPKVNPNESPEQTASRRREYWRIKKREQRAKQSLEVKNRLKEKDSLMRRVKRYQKILEEMRRARAQTLALEGARQTAGMLTHASETIGGFIKEDGTVTINLPHVTADTAAVAAALEAERTSCLLPGGDNIDDDDDDDVDDVLARSQNPPHAGPLGYRRNVALGDSGRPSQRPPPPPLRPAQVRVSLPLRDGQSANKPPRLLSIRPQRTPFQRSAVAAANSNRLAVHSPTQITLTHPPFPGGSSEVSATGGVGAGAGCVMKMAVSSSLLVQPPPPREDPELTEEQRMAKKREYWRVKKREQRAARATKLKHGLLLARGGATAAAAMHRRRTHKQTPGQRGATPNATQGGNVAKQKVSVLPSPNVHMPHPQQAKQIKVEGEPAPAADLNSPPEQAICPVKLPPSPSPPPLASSQPEPDPTLSAETQATTLLAVASMKKLLEESLSTVAECQPADIKTEQPPCKTEVDDYISEEPLEPDMKSHLPMVSLGEEDKLPLAANLTLQIKSWRADPDDLVHSCSQDPYQDQASAQACRSPPPLSPSATQDLQGAADAEAAGCTMSPLRRAKRLCTKRSGGHHQHCCTPEPPKWHASLSDQPPPPPPPPPPQRVQTAPSRFPPQPQPTQPSALQQQCRRPPAGESAGAEGATSARSGMSSLQGKREYWKLMKRQQRARSKARQKGSLGHRQTSRHLAQNTVQALNPLSHNNNNTQAGKGQSPLNRCSLQPKAAAATLTAVHSIPTLLVVSPTTSNVGRSPDTLQVKPPVCSFTTSPSRGQSEVNAPPSGTSCDPDLSACSGTAEGRFDARTSAGPPDGHLRLLENRQEVTQGSSVDDGCRLRKWTVQENVNAAPALATLTPPDNPLSSINLLPIEPLIPPSGCKSSISSPVKPAYSQLPKPKTPQVSPTKLLPISTLASPKLIPGETQDEFLRRKREYWRVKKKEQRAKKAIRDRELSQRRSPGNWKPIRPAKDQDLPQCAETQDPGDCDTACEESEHLMSSTSDAEMGYYSHSSYTAPLEGEHDDPGSCFVDCGLLDGDHGGEDFGPVSDGAWRNRYLMDHDPLNQLLVCMVCGDLLYSHSLEGVRAHIEEAHPDTLNLEPPECRRILDAWDEQVSQRERFFTSQLQQHGATLAEANGT